MRGILRNSPRTIFIVLASLWMAFALTACGGSGGGSGGGGGGGGGGGVPSSCTTVSITSDIDSNTTWTKGNVYVINKFVFYINATLEIEPGVVVKFNPASGPYAVVGPGGTIVANGTSTTPIVFTSYKDDSYCGDTNGDGSATSPAVSDWVNIDTNGENGSSFKYCKFMYGGGGFSFSTLLLSSDSIATVQNSTFAHNTGYIDGVLDAHDAGPGTVIQSNKFYDNGMPLQINPRLSLDNSNVFHNPSSASETNTYNMIAIDGGAYEIDSNISWLETEVPFVIDDNDLYVTTGHVLTLGNNVILKFKPSSEMVLDDGPSAISNHDGTGVYFTSYRDDDHGGDTNNDGSFTNPADNDWGGIYDNNGGAYLNWANILYDSH